MSGIPTTTVQPTASALALVRHRLRLPAILWVVCGTLFAPQLSDAQVQTTVINREHPIKAAFLYQFSRFVEWPHTAYASATSPYVIGVYGESPLSPTLHKIAASKKIAGRTIQVQPVTSPEQVPGCHLIFISGQTSQAEISALTAQSQDHPVLLVGESEEFLQRGGDIQFFVENNKVRFAFHDRVAERHDLKVSSKLLSLARPVPAK